jgi:hypothetical protein
MKTSVKIALLVVVFVAFGGILAALYMYNLKPKDLQKEKPHFVITAAEFQKAFEENEKASSEKYINKIIEISGEIITIEAATNSSWNITLQTASDFSKVLCTFPAIRDSSVFVAGKQVTLRGVCSGFLSDVLLNNCAVISSPK